MIGKVILRPKTVEDILENHLGEYLYDSPSVSIKSLGLLGCIDQAFSIVEYNSQTVTHMVTNWELALRSRLIFGKVIVDQAHLDPDLDKYDWAFYGNLFTARWIVSNQMGNKTLFFGENLSCINCELDYGCRQ